MKVFRWVPRPVAAYCLAGLSISTLFLAFAQTSTPVATANKLRHRHDWVEFAKVPDEARERPNPLQDDQQAIAAGRKLFLQHCAECHGETAEGGHKAPSLRSASVQNATPGTLFWIMTNGVVRRGMPVWSKLPEPQRWQIVTFLKTLSTETALEQGSTPSKLH